MKCLRGFLLVTSAAVCSSGSLASAECLGFESAFEDLLPFIAEHYDLGMKTSHWSGDDRGLFAVPVYFSSVSRLLDGSATQEDAQLFQLLDNNASCWLEKMPEESQRDMATILGQPEAIAENEAAAKIARKILK
jgi:hypothetical protein